MALLPRPLPPLQGSRDVLGPVEEGLGWTRRVEVTVISPLTS